MVVAAALGIAAVPLVAIPSFFINPVNNPAADTISDNDTQSETSMNVFGNVIVVGYNDSGSYNLPGNNRFTGYARSLDGGVTFTDMGGFPAAANGDAGDPIVARNNTSGRLYFATLMFSGSGIQVFRSDDNAATWQAPVNGAPGKSGFQDKEWLTVDNFAGPGQGNVYLAVRDFGAGNGIYFFRSTDNGATYGPNGGTLITAGSQGANLVVGPDHAVYAFWYDSAVPRRIRMRKSTDLGVTFGAPITVTTLLGTGTNGDLGLTGIRFNTVTPASFRSNSFPQAVINPVSGHIYTVFNDNPAGVDRADSYLVQSTDGGATWGPQVRINSDAGTNDNWQPTPAVTPDGQALAVGWMDRRSDPGNNLIEYWVRTATISGATVTFDPEFMVGGSFFPEFGRDSLVNTTYMGDYDQAQADNGFFYFTWSSNANASILEPTRKQADVLFAKVTRPSSAPPTLTGIITAKSGPTNARSWTMTLSNSGPGAATSSQIDSLALTQTSGPACTPVILSSFPLLVGPIPVSSSASASATIDFTGCAPANRWQATFNFSGNPGAVSGSKTLNNQFR